MFISALIFGLLGSFHCIGMCGPIAFLLPLDRQNRLNRLLQIFLYHSGRLFSYSIIGLAFGLVGKGLGLFGLQQQLSIFIGVLMLFLILFPKANLGKLDAKNFGFRFVAGLKNRLGKELRKKRPDTFFTVGFLNGFLPCGLVYMAVLGAVASGTAIEGGFYMLLFGVGTIPLMTSAIWVSNIISVKSRKYIRSLVPVFVGLMAILFILRGLGLGIPYVSPELKTHQVNSEYECHTPLLITKS